MTRSVENRVKALMRKAKTEGRREQKSSGTRRRSSLHKVIKTKDQAAAFMKLLQSS